jgi:hypothetical protein
MILLLLYVAKGHSILKFDLKVAIQYEDDMADSVCDRIDNTGASNFTKAIQTGTSQNQCGSGSASVWSGFVSKVRKNNA